MTKKKEVRKSSKKHRRNARVRSGIKKAIAEFTQAVSSSDESASKEKLQKAVKLLDKAASKGTIHPNTAARKKSRLAKKVTAGLEAAKPDSE